MKRQRQQSAERGYFVASLRASASFPIAFARCMILNAVALTTGLLATAGEPFIPSDSNEVLEVLPRSLFSTRDEFATLRLKLAEDPTNIELAADVAARFVDLGKSEGDPRFYGYAQAALGPWWEATDAPSSILKLRAKLNERDHRYDAALADLKLLLRAEAQDVQAWIELANIYRVQGKYGEARKACDELRQFAGTAPTVMCSAPILAVTGQAQEAYDSLSEILPTVKDRWPTAAQWVLTMQAEISRALGNDAQAERHLKEGLTNDPSDYYLLRSYADLLLDQGREEEVVPLLREHVVDTGVLLCAAIAARKSGQQELADQWASQLKSRFVETRLRGDQPHARFEARYELELMNDPEQALALAEANWQQQKEYRDSRNVLEAAIAARAPARARQVVEFLKQHGTQDVLFDRLVQELERQ